MEKNAWTTACFFSIKKEGGTTPEFETTEFWDVNLYRKRLQTI